LTFLSSQVSEMEKRFGIPDSLSFNQPVTETELTRIRRSMKQGRAHDITLFISKGDGYIFIAKPFYPPGLFRAPSGGVHLEEDFEDGARREALEETGVEIKLERYILRIEVRFETSANHIDWTSHIFTAAYLSGEIDPQDKYEISAARLVHLDEIPKFRKIMQESSNGGLKYRVFLTDEALKRL
jgi:ADP-ribose pyrophosphatase YjhB (NUDIX family)